MELFKGGKGAYGLLHKSYVIDTVLNNLKPQFTLTH